MAMKMNNGMTKGRLIFICTWLGIFAAAFLIWAAVLGGVNKDLAKYEEYQPVYAADEAFREYFKESDAATIAGYSKLPLLKYDKSDAIETYLEDLLSTGELTCIEAASEDGSVCYKVMADGEVFAGFTVIEDEDSKEIFGKRGYTIGEVYLLIEPKYEANIIAPKNAVVKINGVVVEDDMRVGDYKELEDAEYFPADDPDARLMAVYHIDGLFTAPEVTVTNKAGNIAYGVELDRPNSLYDTEYSYRTVLAEIYNGTFVEPDVPIVTPGPDNTDKEVPHSDFLYEALTIYEKYTRLTNEDNDQAAWRVLSFFKPGTEIYSVIMSYYNDSNFFPDNYEFSEVKISDFAWTDATEKSFTCTYEMKAVMWVSGKDNKVTETIRYFVEVDVSGAKPLIVTLRKTN